MSTKQEVINMARAALTAAENLDESPIEERIEKIRKLIIFIGLPFAIIIIGLLAYAIFR